MCFLESGPNPNAVSQRRKATIVAGSAGSLGGIGAFLSSQGHRGVLWLVIAAQLCLVIISLKLLTQSKRGQASVEDSTT